MQLSTKQRVYHLEEDRKRQDQVITNQHLAIIALSANIEVLTNILKETVPDIEEQVAILAKKKIESVMEKSTTAVVEDTDPILGEDGKVNVSENLKDKETVVSDAR